MCENKPVRRTPVPQAARRRRKALHREGKFLNKMGWIRYDLSTAMRIRSVWTPVCAARPKRFFPGMFCFYHDPETVVHSAAGAKTAAGG